VSISEELVCRTLGEKCLDNNTRELVGNVKDLHQVWETLDVGLDWVEKYPMLGARGVNLLSRLDNEQTLQSMMGRMPNSDWKQWAKERPTWIQQNVAEVVWRFVYQKWRDALNVAAAEPSGTDAGREAKKLAKERGQKDDD
jgi:hypothetical protein